MLVETHLLLSTAVFGTSISGYIGSILPDTFTALKWLLHIPTGLKNIRNFFKSPKKYKETVVGGPLRDLARLSHSVFILLIIIIMLIYARINKNYGLSTFSAAWILHVLSDYLTHKKKILPLYPVNTKWEFPISIDLFNPKNILYVIFIDSTLFVLSILRLFL
jgi:hypothetical protein